MGHPNLSDEINRNIAQSEIEGGVWIFDAGFGPTNKNVLPVGRVLLIRTRNRVYHLEKRGEREFYISGHPEYCPHPTKAFVNGSTWGGSMLKVGFVGRGMRLAFATDLHKCITTSTIQEITEDAGSNAKPEVADVSEPVDLPRYLPRYQCHKEVRALKIREIRVEDVPGDPNCTRTMIVPEEDGFAPFPVTRAYIEKHKPKAGGYFVLYEDGYQSFSPAKAFEEGYTRI